MNYALAAWLVKAAITFRYSKNSNTCEIKGDVIGFIFHIYFNSDGNRWRHLKTRWSS